MPLARNVKSRALLDNLTGDALVRGRSPHARARYDGEGVLPKSRSAGAARTQPAGIPRQRSAVRDHRRVGVAPRSSASRAASAPCRGPPKLNSGERQSLGNPHLVIFNRYALPWGSELVRLFRRRGAAAVYHLDDELLAIPPELGDAVSAHHGTPEIVRAREAMLTAVDHVQPSTEQLAHRLLIRMGAANVMKAIHPPSCLAFADRGSVESRAGIAGRRLHDVQVTRARS